MRRFAAVLFVLLITTAAYAAPNDSSDRNRPGTFVRIVRAIKHIIAHPLDDILEQPGTPVPAPSPLP